MVGATSSDGFLFFAFIYCCTYATIIKLRDSKIKLWIYHLLRISVALGALDLNPKQQNLGPSHYINPSNVAAGSERMSNVSNVPLSQHSQYVISESKKGKEGLLEVAQV